METMVSGRETEVRFGQELPTIIIGERINPTGRKKLTEELKKGIFDIVVDDAISQEKAGASIIDVNVGGAGIDELDILPRAVEKVMEATGLPVCIDSSNPEAIEAALNIYPYKPLINSTNGKEEVMEKILPLVKQSGGAVICLTMDENGIKNDVDLRLKVADKIVSRADKAGIKRENLVFDPLVLAAATDSSSARVSLESMKKISGKYGVSTTMGVSNISFGMPERPVLNLGFLTMGILNGLCAPIVDPSIPGIHKIMKAADFLSGRDQYGMNYIAMSRK